VIGDNSENRERFSTNNNHNNNLETLKLPTNDEEKQEKNIGRRINKKKDNRNNTAETKKL